MKRKLVAAMLAASLVVSAAAPASAQRVVLPPTPATPGAGAGGWIVAGIACAALGPILTTMIVNRPLTNDEAVLSMLFCVPPGLYGAILKDQDSKKPRRRR